MSYLNTIAGLESQIAQLQDTRMVEARERDRLRSENVRLRAALTQFVACCDTAPPISLMIELVIACKVARAALSPADRS